MESLKENMFLQKFLIFIQLIKKREGIKKDAANKYLKPRGILFSWIYFNIYIYLKRYRSPTCMLIYINSSTVVALIHTIYCMCGCSWGCKHQLQQVIQLIHVQDQCLLLLITVC